MFEYSNNSIRIKYEIQFFLNLISNYHFEEPDILICANDVLKKSLELSKQYSLRHKNLNDFFFLCIKTILSELNMKCSF